MEEDIKRELDAIFTDDKNRREKFEKKRDLEAEAQAEFKKSFLKLRDDLIAPAFREFANYVNSQGWATQVEVDNEKDDGFGSRSQSGQSINPNSVTVYFNRGYSPGRMAQLSHKLPHFSMSCSERTRRIVFFKSTMGPNHGGSSGGDGEARIEDITSIFVQKKLLAYFKVLVSDSRPYGEN